MALNRINTLHHTETEIIDRFLEKLDKEENEAENSQKTCCMDGPPAEFPIEFSFIDFKWLIIGEKLKHVDLPNSLADHKLLFDDDYFATMLMAQEENLEFYGNSVVQNIIDYQF